VLEIEKILRQDRLLRATTGLNRQAFEALLIKFEQVYLGSKDQEKQKENYSGRTSHAPGVSPGGVSSKKKRHTSKNLAVVAQSKRILVLSPSTKGKTHDKKIHDQEDII
jgi:hypothetical protein